jgi:hypothetical protein
MLLASCEGSEQKEVAEVQARWRLYKLLDRITLDERAGERLAREPDIERHVVKMAPMGDDHQDLVYGGVIELTLIGERLGAGAVAIGPYAQAVAVLLQV